jgi:endonuclease/exonuclease/phosphatase family metal-dependent hydrolase
MPKKQRINHRPKSAGTQAEFRRGSAWVAIVPGRGRTPFNGSLVAVVICSLLWASLAFACPGDCSDDWSVDVSELVTGVGIALGQQPIGACRAFDRNGNGGVTVDELISAVAAALSGCGDAKRVSAMIGSVGGMLEMEGARLLVPAGALSETETLTLTRLDDRPPEGYEAYSPLFRLDPADLTLNGPVYLTLAHGGSQQRSLPRRLGLYCAGREGRFRLVPLSDILAGKLRALVSGMETCFVAAVADQSSADCPDGPGPGRCIVVHPVRGPADLSVVDGTIDPDPDEYRFSRELPFADTALQASGGRISVTVDRDPTSVEGAVLRVFLKGLPMSNRIGKVAVVLDHDRFVSEHGDYVSAEDHAYRLNLWDGGKQAFKGNVDPQDPSSQPAWLATTLRTAWDAKVGTIETIHPTDVSKPDYFRVDAEFSITLPRVVVPTDGSLPGIGFSVQTRSDWPDSFEHVWGAFPEQSHGSPDGDYPAERAVFQTLLFAGRPAGTPVTILSWNVKRFTSYQHSQERLFKPDAFDDTQVDAATIGRAIAGFDVVALQEVWDPEQADAIFNAASAVDPTRPYYRVGPVMEVIPEEVLPSLKSFMGARTGGVYIFSRYPISAMGQETFEQCVGEDCLYPKGFLWARVWLGAPDQEFKECVKGVSRETPLDETDCPMPTGSLYLDIVATHLNAGSELCDDTNALEWVKGKAVEFLQTMPTAIYCPLCFVLKTALDNDLYCGLRDSKTVRERQLEQISAFLHKNDLDSREVVITGDFNIDGRTGTEPAYIDAIRALSIRSPYLYPGEQEFDTMNPYPADFDWDIDRGDLVQEYFKGSWMKEWVGTNIGATYSKYESNSRYDYILVRAANTKSPSHVVAKGSGPLWQRIWMGPPQGGTPDRYSDHMAVAASLQVVPFQDPPKYHPQWSHLYEFRVVSAVGTGDDGVGQSQEELYAQIARYIGTPPVITWKTPECSTKASVTWPGDNCMSGWTWLDVNRLPSGGFPYLGGVFLWEEDSQYDDKYGVIATPHGRDGMTMSLEWPTGWMFVRDWSTGQFVPTGWTDFPLTDNYPVTYSGLDGHPSATMRTVVVENQP